MRPILFPIPAKPLFFLAIALGVLSLVRDVIRRRKDPKHRVGSTALYLFAGAGILWYLKHESQPWTPVPIYAYGVMLGTSLVVGWFIAMRLAKTDGIDQQEAGTIYMWTAVWSIIGARLLYVITNISEFDSLLQVVMVNRGGLVAYGGMIGGFLASWYGCRKRKIPLLQWADVAAPSVVLGTAITRMGCFLFGCDYGARSSLPWALKFPGPGPFPRSESGSPAWQHHVRDFGLDKTADWSFPVHPTQLYEVLVGLSLFGLLMLIRRYRTFSGQVFLGWVIGYGILRPLIELVRDDDQRGNIGPLSTSQFIGIVSVALGLGLLVALVRRYRRDPDGLRLWLKPVHAAAAPVAAQSGRSSDHGGGKRRKRR
jgi:phosphatidylglycerol---prolipoprotein diacylglyceryl transferase